VNNRRLAIVFVILTSTLTTLLAVVTNAATQNLPSAVEQHPAAAWSALVGIAVALALLAVIGLRIQGVGQPASTPLLPAPTPAELPARQADFRGRTDELAELTRWLTAAASSGAAVNCAINGRPGVGKTVIAIQAAHLVKKHFPGGQIYLDLHSSLSESSPKDILPRLLFSLGMQDAARLPHDEQVALYRSLAAERGTLIVLDDVASDTQVKPLLLGGGGAALLATGRRRLNAIDDEHTIDLTEPGEDEAVAMLQAVAGREIGETGDVRRLIEACGRLPLALRIAGAQLASDRALRAGDLAARLRDEVHRLRRLNVGEWSVQAAFRSAYVGLDRPARALFARLGVLPAADFGPWVAPILVRGERGVLAFDALVRSRLVDPVGHGPAGRRYRLHVLLRLEARERAGTLLRRPAARRAQTRLLRQALALAQRADRQLSPVRLHVRELEKLHPTLVDVAKDAQSNPTQWLEAELTSLSYWIGVANRRRPALAWRLAATLPAYLEMRSDWEAWIRSHEVALRAARRTHNRYAVALTLTNLADAEAELGRRDLAMEHFEQAAALFEKIDLPSERAYAMSSLGNVYLEEDRRAEAAELFDKVLDIARTHDDPRSMAHGSRGRAIYCQLESRWDEALASYQSCLTAVRELGDRRWEALTMRSLGMLRHLQGDFVGAARDLRISVGVFAEQQDLRWEARTEAPLADSLQRMGRTDEARKLLDKALRQAEVTRDVRWQVEVLRTLAIVLAQQSKCFAADAAIARATRLLGDRVPLSQQVRLRCNQAEVHVYCGKPVQALDEIRPVVRVLRESFVDLRWRARSTLVMARAEAQLGDYAAAVASASEARSLFGQLGSVETRDVNAFLRWLDAHRR
jgi:tetratricopeptide (TPR) repeat protein